MATEFEMPKLGLTMEFGTILQWLVADGDQVAEGQPIMVIETDKVETEVESSGGGRFHAAAVVGETYDCGTHLGWFLEEGEEVPAGPASDDGGGGADSIATGGAVAGATEPVAAAVATTGVGASVDSGGRIMASPNAKRVAGERGVELSKLVGTGPGGRIVSEDVETAPPSAGGRIMASPNAKRLAGERGVNLGSVTGTGPGGRITSEDVEAAPVTTIAEFGAGSVGTGAAGAGAGADGHRGATPPATVAARQLADLLGVDLALVPASPPDPRITKADVALHVRQLLAQIGSGGGAGRPDDNAKGARALPAMPLLQTPTTVVPLKGMRGTIATRMHGALTEMAQLTLMMDVDMGAVVADRKARGESGPKPGFTDYVIAASAKALRAHPYANSQVTDDGVAYLPEVHVGMAVALDDGLMVPVVRSTDTLSIEELSAETTRLAEATRAGGLKLADLEGGTFSVTALGMFGVDGFTPVINPPNTAILGVGRLRDDVAWSDDGTPMKATRLTLSLTWDHRAFDGAPAAEFVSTIKTNLEGV